MDYEKKYNEALKRAKVAIDIAADKDLVKGIATTIFPELRESEDERIRRWIVEELEITRDAMSGKNDYSDDPDIVARLKRLDEAIYWLEKQKEQKPVEWSEEDTEMYINVASSLRGYACGLENEEHKRHIKKGLDWLENRFKSLRGKYKED